MTPTLSNRLYPLGCMAVVLGCALWLVTHLQLGEQLGQLWQRYTVAEPIRQRSIWLGQYQFIERLQLPGIEANASDIIHVPELQRYFVLVNKPAGLFEYNESFQLMARYDLPGFEDPEALSYDGNGHLLIAEERRQTVVRLAIKQLSQPIVRAALPAFELGERADNNRGVEGIAFDSDSAVLFASQEKQPMRLFEVVNGVPTADTSSRRLPRTQVSALVLWRLRLSDISALHYDLQTRHLLVLSDESKRLVEVDSGYAPLSFLDLQRGLHGLDEGVPQAEGVTLGPRREIVIVSEPNLLYRYGR
ncbi:SdiA-regulated domain-containing protein [Pseudomonas wayambapalatensis]|uniref:SdiA-regulated domain-containing protein n=1 Tax=Pseudomonas TaxID=286 RepID=UPI001645686C|nr:SdiA-regulated domain-containing protein [Pseudomonas sp. RW3S2]MBC3421265.1 SdiA-regulated domain-containing protein [Pseudomonas sp. RW3S2]